MILCLILTSCGVPPKSRRHGWREGLRLNDGSYEMQFTRLSAKAAYNQARTLTFGVTDA